MGLINKAGAWYTLSFLTDKKEKMQGIEKVRQYLVDNPKAYELLYSGIKNLIGLK